MSIFNLILRLLFRFLLDDFGLDTFDTSKQTVVTDLIVAADDLAASLEVTLKLPISKNKAAVLASSSDVAARVRGGLKGLGGRVVTTTRNLGIDFGGQRARAGFLK